jgi:hypothetical protein
MRVGWVLDNRRVASRSRRTGGQKTVRAPVKRRPIKKLENLKKTKAYGKIGAIAQIKMETLKPLLRYTTWATYENAITIMDGWLLDSSIATNALSNSSTPQCSGTLLLVERYISLLRKIEMARPQFVGNITTSTRFRKWKIISSRLIALIVLRVNTRNFNIHFRPSLDLLYRHVYTAFTFTYYKDTETTVWYIPSRHSYFAAKRNFHTSERRRRSGKFIYG